MEITAAEAREKRAMTKEDSVRLTRESEWTVKNVKFHAGHDGPGFNLSLYKGKQRVATVYDDSYGGGLQFTWLKHEAEAEFEKEANSLCEYSNLMKGFMVYGEDTYIDRLINHFEETKQFKKHCKTKTCFKLKDQAEGEFYTIATPFGPSVADRLRTKHGDNLEIIYNEHY